MQTCFLNYEMSMLESFLQKEPAGSRVVPSIEQGDPDVKGPYDI